MNEGLSFHAAMAALSGNPVLDLICQSVGHIVSDYTLMATSNRELEDWIVHDHSNLAQAIIAGEATKAERLMKRHIETLLKKWERLAPQRVGERIAFTSAGGPALD